MKSCPSLSVARLESPELKVPSATARNEMFWGPLRAGSLSPRTFHYGRGGTLESTAVTILLFGGYIRHWATTKDES